MFLKKKGAGKTGYVYPHMENGAKDQLMHFSSFKLPQFPEQDDSYPAAFLGVVLGPC